MSVCLFVCLFVCSPTPPRSLGRSSPNLEGRWRAAPDISLRGSLLKGQGHRGQRSILCVFYFLFVPLLLPGPWVDLHQTWVQLGQRSSRAKVIFSVGHVFFFCLFPYFSQVLGPILTKLGGKV